MKKAFIISGVLIIAAVVLAVVFNVVGGPVDTRNFDVDPFTGISIGGAFRVEFRESDTFAVVIEMREDQFAHHNVTVTNGILRIYQTGILNNFLNFDFGRNAPRVYIYAPYLSHITLSGAARTVNSFPLRGDSVAINTSGSARGTFGVDTQTLTVASSGSSNVTISGNAANATINTSGSVRFNGFDLQTITADVNSSGSSRVNISVLGQLSANSSGSSRVRYSGDPSVNSRTSGSSTVRQN
ncbi:MAG: DUF2807 domain-containing protein [Defluviitaleaceae bacterium]|nr:DUF2807 domain-containing protein [Defluviitaleaceae bacterium]